MTTYWTIQDNTGRHLPHFIANSRIEVGRKIVPAYYDIFRLHVSASYRQAFERALLKVLEQEGWQIVRTCRPRQGAALAGLAGALAHQASSRISLTSSAVLIGRGLSCTG